MAIRIAGQDPSRDGASTHADLLGAARLTTEAVSGITDLVEAMHLNILKNTPGKPLAGVTSMVYRAVRGVTRLVGGGLDAALGRLVQEDSAAGDWQGREAVLAALNGVLGDHLERSANPLATPMTMRLPGGAPLVQPIAQASGRILVLVHGLCMNDLQWQADGGGIGSALARERGFTTVYLRYNTGRTITTHGEEFARQLEALLDAWPVAVEELMIIGHSMGGLVARSACRAGELAGHRWRAHLARLVTLGSPHHGAPLERGGNWLTMLLGRSSYSAPFVRLAKVRSEGITDLRHGSALPLPEGVACYAVAGTVAGDASASAKVADALLGDGLVPLPSALGIDKDPALCLHFTATATLRETNHMALLSAPAVTQQLLAWTPCPKSANSAGIDA